MMIRDELKRLIFEPDANTGINLMQVEVSCEGNAQRVFEGATEALAVILSVQNIFGNKDDSITDDSYVLLESWFESTFLANVDDDEISRDTKRLRWFGEGRDWFWWTARVKDENHLFAYLLITGFPVSGFDELRWLLRCCGASQVEQGPAVKCSDIPTS